MNIKPGDTFADLYINGICVIRSIDEENNIVELYYDCVELNLNDNGCTTYPLGDFLYEIETEVFIKY